MNALRADGSGSSHPRGRWFVGMLTALALVVSACGSNGAEGPATEGEGNSPTATETGSPAAVEPSGEPVVIGVLTDLTGPGAGVGEYDERWAQLYENRVNNEGGIDGRPLEIVVYDTGLDPAQAATFARRLIEQDGAVAITCCISSSEALQVAAVGEELGVAAMGGAIVGQLTNQDEPWYGWYLRVLPGEEDTAYFNIDFAAEQGWSSLAISHSNLTYGTSGESILRERASETDIEIVESVPIAPDASEASAQAATLSRTGADAVLTWDYPGPTALVAGALRDTGYEGAIVSNWSALNEQFWAVAGTGIQDMYAHDAYDPRNPRAEEVIGSFADEFGDTPWSIHQLMQAAYLETAIEGIRAVLEDGSGEVTGEAVRDAIVAQDCLETVIGPEDSCLQFGREYESAAGVNPYHGGSRDLMVMKTVDNGEWVLAE